MRFFVSSDRLQHYSIKMFIAIILPAWFILSYLKFAESTCMITKYEQVNSVLKNCTTIVIGDLVVPAGKPLNLQPLDGTVIFLTGEISFQYHVWAGPLVQINATRLEMVGTEGAVWNGNGQLYWDGKGGWGSVKPGFVQITASDSKFENLEFFNSPEFFLLISDSKNVTFSKVTLDNINGDPDRAGEDHAGHNTDGFVVFNGTDITIESSWVYNQDDCIAIRHGDNIHVKNMYCHGGHGISLSVGFSNTSIEENTLTNVLVEDSQMYFGQNAIHIKTHVDATNGSITNVTYRNIWFQGQTNYGITIQQNYRNLPPSNSTHPEEATGNIPIRNLNFQNIAGTVSGSKAVGVYINCADGACVNWEWTNVKVPDSKFNCNFQPNGFSC